MSTAVKPETTAAATDVGDWENDFLQSIMRSTREGDNTTVLTEKQIDVVERIFKKHFSN